MADRLMEMRRGLVCEVVLKKSLRKESEAYPFPSSEYGGQVEGTNYKVVAMAPYFS